MPEPETTALELTCAECGRSPRRGEVWRAFSSPTSARPWPTARSAPSESSGPPTLPLSPTPGGS